jgi:hypothetical protein
VSVSHRASCRCSYLGNAPVIGKLDASERYLHGVHQTRLRMPHRGTADLGLWLNLLRGAPIQG